MHWIFSLYVAFLFFILTPAILVRLPPKAGKFTVAGFHAVVFALILHFTGKMVWNFSRGLEGFQEGLNTKKQMCVGYKGTNNVQSIWTDASGNTTGNVGKCKFADGVASNQQSGFCPGSYSSSTKTCTFN